jgi:hypothetical protein
MDVSYAVGSGKRNTRRIASGTHRLRASFPVNPMATNNPTEPRTYPAEKARQGEIILRSRASRIIFIAALAGR